MRTQPDKSKACHGFQRHFSAFAGFIVAGALLAGCAATPPRNAVGQSAAQPLAQLVLPPARDSEVAARLIAAEFALQHNAMGPAAQDYAQAAMISSDPALAQRAFKVALAAQDANTAQRVLLRWQSLGADFHQLAGARAQIALLRGDAATAQQQLGILLTSAKPADWKEFAAALLAARDSAQAGRLLENLATPTRLPPDAQLWVAFSELAEHLGRHAFARQLADAAVRRFDSTDAIRWAASLHVTGGDKPGALELYRHGVAAHPGDPALRLGYATLLADAGHTADALAVLAHGPQTPATWSARVGYAARAKDDVALRALYAELGRAPAGDRADNAWLLGQLAELLQHDGQALVWYAKVDPDGEHAFDAQVRTAVLLDKQGQSTQAHALAERLQQRSIDDADDLRTAYELDAQLYARRGAHAQAIAVYDRALQVLPDDPVLVYDRGITRADAGDTDAALADFRKVLQQDPDNIEAMNALGFTLVDANRDLPEATALLRKALVAKPDAAEVMDSWGWLQYRLGNLGQAESYLQRAWGRQQDPDIGVHLGQVLWKLGEHDHARAVFATVRKLDPRNAALLRVQQGLQP